jgi:hypothetical protein
MSIGTIEIPGQKLPPLGYAPFSAGPVASGLLSPFHAVYPFSTLAPVGFGSAPILQGANNFHNVTFPDGFYWTLGDAGGANNTARIIVPNAAITPEGFAQLRFQPIHLEMFVRTAPVNQTDYRVWAGLQASTIVVLSDTLGLGCAFRYNHPAPAGPDSGNWFFVVNDGAAQQDIDTGVPVVGGLAGLVSTPYRLMIDVSATAIEWTVTNLTTGVGASGTVTIPGAFSLTTALFITVNVCDIAGGVKNFSFGKIMATANT